MPSRFSWRLFWPLRLCEETFSEIPLEAQDIEEPPRLAREGAYIRDLEEFSNQQ